MMPMSARALQPSYVVMAARSIDVAVPMCLAGRQQVQPSLMGLLMGAGPLPERAGPQLFSPTRVSCGSGQQHPLRAPHRVQRIAFDIVSSDVSA